LDWGLKVINLDINIPVGMQYVKVEELVNEHGKWRMNNLQG
jgi:hypothetical protein